MEKECCLHLLLADPSQQRPPSLAGKHSTFNLTRGWQLRNEQGAALKLAAEK